MPYTKLHSLMGQCKFNPNNICADSCSNRFKHSEPITERESHPTGGPPTVTKSDSIPGKRQQSKVRSKLSLLTALLFHIRIGQPDLRTCFICISPKKLPLALKQPKRQPHAIHIIGLFAICIASFIKTSRFSICIALWY